MNPRVTAVFLVSALLLAEAGAQSPVSYTEGRAARPCPAGVTCSDGASEPTPANVVVPPRPTPPAIVTPPSENGIISPRADMPKPAQPAQPAEPEEASEFQGFVSSSLGRKLDMFGYSLFEQVPTTFAPVDRVPVTPDYVVGPGDELLIRAWGQIDVDARVVVDRAGQIYLPKVGNLSVAGLRFDQLQEYLKSSIGRVFKNFDLNVNLGQLRSIQIFVMGQARRPGSYTISSLSTMVNALFASGGPSNRGSMRHIQLKRNNQVITEFDMYDLLLKGDKSRDAKLLPGDIIFIPPIGPQVALAGSVSVPAIYELNGDTTLGHAIEMGSGLTNVADGQKVTVERIYNRTTRRIAEFPLNEAGFARQLQDGDVVYVVPLSPRFEDAVTLRGNVAVPGRYPWHAGMRVRDLIPTREALITRDYWVKQNLTGRSAYQVTKAWDGEKKAANVDESTLRMEVRRNAPEINWDYALVQRLNIENLSTRLIPFNLGRAIHGDNNDNMELQAGDVITVFSQADLRVPVRAQSKYVYLEGEFKAAGVYKVGPTETLRHLVARAGGLTPQAYLFGAEFTRESTRVEQQKNLDEMVRRISHEVERTTASSTAKASTSDDAALLKIKLDERREQVAKLKELKATGRIVLEMQPADNGVDDLPDIVLQDGDRFYVPYRQPLVNVAGEVYNSSSFLYDAHKNVADYIKQAGGTTRYADRGRMFLLRADGSVVPRRASGGFWKGSFDNVKLMPGDSIVVPENIATTSVLKEVKDWSQVFSQFALGAAAVRVLNRP